MYCFITRWTLAALTVIALSASRPAAAQNYTFQTVDAPGVDHSVISIHHCTWLSDTGLIVQQYFSPDDDLATSWGHAALFQDGIWSLLDVPGSIWCGGTRPNAKGEVALTYASVDGANHMAIWRRGVYTLLPDLPGYEILAKGINNPGKVVGFAFDPAGNEHGFVRDVGGFTFFDHPLASPGTAAFAVNDTGTVIGWYDAPDGSVQSFRKDGGQFETIAPPGNIFTFALAINNSGVIGGVYLDTGFNFHGFLLRNGRYTVVDYPGAWITKIDSINDRGEISGDYITIDGITHGYVATPIPGS